jgi:hypothetical protein
VLEQREDKFAQQATIVKMTTDGKVLTVNATYSTPGEAGPYPIAKLSANDPFFETLAHAETATFQVGGSEIVFKLMGSMQGLKKFDELCH